MNLAPTIIPRSDQKNADDLLAGPQTIKITAVESGSKEQPVLIHYEGENGRPYKPGLSMRRVLVSMWGKDGAAYVGRRLVLYCDPEITFGPMKCGGIRISHASDIAEAFEIALTVTRGKKKMFRVEPLQDAPQATQFDLQALQDVGETKAREGLESLRNWWGTLPKEAQRALKSKLDGDWKRLAEEAQ